MINLYYWSTPNGHKITIFLEEAGLPYQIMPVNIQKDEQFTPEYLRISPNNKIPAIVDHAPQDQGKSITVFESGAILIYLAEKAKRFIPESIRERTQVLEWLFWQVAGLGPMAGQNHHFSHFAPEVIPYAINRYVKETARLYGVLDKQLKDKKFIAGDYSIADMATYPWIVGHEMQGQDLKNFPNIQRWFEALHSRPAIQRAYEKAEAVKAEAALLDESKPADSCSIPPDKK